MELDFRGAIAAENFIGARIGGGLVADHGEAERARGELFGLRVDGALRAPPPGFMDERAVGGIHQADDGVIDMAGEDAGGDVGEAVGHGDGHGGHFRCFAGAGIDPDEAVAFDAGEGAGADFFGVGSLIDVRRNARAGAGHIETPAVVAAFDFATIEATVAQGHAAMGAEIFQRADGAGFVAQEEEFITEQGDGQHTACCEHSGRGGDVPEIVEELGVLLHGAALNGAWGGVKLCLTRLATVAAWRKWFPRG